MQALQLLALEPVAETTADRISFGLKYRSPEDAREYAFSVLSRKDSPQWILEGYKKLLDKISHRWMMDNIPKQKNYERVHALWICRKGKVISDYRRLQEELSRQLMQTWYLMD